MTAASPLVDEPEDRDVSFLTSHALVLLEISKDPDVTVREISVRTELTERQAHRILSELAKKGYVLRTRIGRRNHYEVNGSLPVDRRARARKPVGFLLRALTD